MRTLGHAVSLVFALSLGCAGELPTESRDPAVLDALRALQDTSTPDKVLLASCVGSPELQLFNNMLASMAFTLEGERVRAARILSFHQDRLAPSAGDPLRQQFHRDGEARGFFQRVAYDPESGEYRALPGSDRWLGDLCWMVLACRHYEAAFDDPAFRPLADATLALLRSWFVDLGDGTGYVGHGWRNLDARLHEDHGHHEGNIDVAAVFRVCGEDELAEKVERWLARELDGVPNLPLDLYTWRALRAGEAGAALLAIPDGDPRYRKTVDGAVGFWPFAAADVENIWLDGIGHMACAWFAVGRDDLGRFYTDQYDKLLITQTIDGREVKGLPYTLQRTPGFEWVDPQAIFVSANAWYVFAKRGFNPFVVGGDDEL